jgi:hypothetical protein
MAKLTFRETTIEFKEVTSIQLEKLTFPNGVKSGERTLHTYDVYNNGTKLPIYTLTVLNEGKHTAEYRLYIQTKDADMELLYGFYDFQNFPYNAITGLYQTIVQPDKYLKVGLSLA